MRISDWSSDVCSSDLPALDRLWRRTRTYASPDTIPSSGSLRRMARGPVAVGIPGWTTALAGTEGTRVQGESEYRCTMGRQAARRPQSTGTRPAADAGRPERPKIGRTSGGKEGVRTGKTT